MSENQPGNGKLDSWKEIAAYLGKDVRTVIRWEKKRNLPVHRLPGGQAVFAYKSELDDWLQQKEDPVNPERPIEAAVPTGALLLETANEKNEGRYSGRNRVFILGMIGLALMAVSVAIFRHHPVAAGIALTVRIQFAANAIRAYDDADHLLWTHIFPKPVHPEVLKHPELTENLVRIADLYGDGGWEALVTVPLEQNADPHTMSLTEIDCFSNTGKLLWSYLPHEYFRFGEYELDGPWIVEDVFISQTAKPIIWAALAHYRWGNSFVAELDPTTGKATVRFVNTGLVYKLNETRIDGKPYLLMGGFNNEYASGMLAAIDESKPYAVSPQTAGTRHKCLSCPEGAPDYYFVFPRSEINQLYHAWEDSVRFINVQGNTIEVEKAELGDPALGDKADVGKVHVVYDFRADPTLRPTALRFDSWYDMMHRDLQTKSQLNHGIDSCAERLHPTPVRLWKPDGGWSQITLTPAAR
jgi:predicted DNA-binding transcriptional regulator AlpA